MAKKIKNDFVKWLAVCIRNKYTHNVHRVLVTETDGGQFKDGRTKVDVDIQFQVNPYAPVHRLSLSYTPDDTTMVQLRDYSVIVDTPARFSEWMPVINILFTELGCDKNMHTVMLNENYTAFAWDLVLEDDTHPFATRPETMTVIKRMYKRANCVLNDIYNSGTKLRGAQKTVIKNAQTQIQAI